jgi:hypothetical protein
MISDIGPTWRGITVGKSMVDDVISALGVPASVEQELCQVVFLYREDPFEWGEHHIVIHNEVVERIEEDILAYSYDVSLTQFIDQYGTPDAVMWSREGPELRVAIFLNEGIFVSATARSLNKAQATRAFYYRPRSLLRLLVDFRDEISPSVPFPDSDVVGPRDPWFETP